MYIYVYIRRGDGEQASSGTEHTMATGTPYNLNPPLGSGFQDRKGAWCSNCPPTPYPYTLPLHPTPTPYPYTLPLHPTLTPYPYTLHAHPTKH